MLFLKYLCGVALRSHRACWLGNCCAGVMGSEHVREAVGDVTWRGLFGLRRLCAFGCFGRQAGHLGHDRPLSYCVWDRARNLGMPSFAFNFLYHFRVSSSTFLVISLVAIIIITVVVDYGRNFILI